MTCACQTGPVAVAVVAVVACQDLLELVEEAVEVPWQFIRTLEM